MPLPLREHPLRHALTRELHARPFASLVAPQRTTHLALLSGEGAGEADRAHVARLCRHFGAAPPGEGETHLMAELGPFQLKWERHTEFSTYTFFAQPEPGAAAAPPDPFQAPAIALVPKDWLEGLPGELLVGVHLALEAAQAPERDVEALVRLFGTSNVAGSRVAGGAADIWMDFALREDGFGRILVHDRRLYPRQAGRVVQRLLEIETYRMMALLALPVARGNSRALTAAYERLQAITARMTEIAELEDERGLLAELTGLSAEIEDMAAASSYRFGAARAYYALVQHRVEELREERIEGFQTVREFLERRLAPAMRTCQAVAERLETLSGRVSRASELLRTRVDIQLEAQNRDLLRSMNRRARLQLRLQQTVEGLSVAAISYYLVSLVGYGARAVKGLGVPLDVDLVTGLAIPVVAGAVGYGIWRFHRLLGRSADRGEA